MNAATQSALPYSSQITIPVRLFNWFVQRVFFPV
jgi:hypothetical protein